MKSRTTIVMGAGISGIAAARLAKSLEHDVLLLDEGKNDHLTALAKTLGDEGIQCVFGGCPSPETLPAADDIVLSPGIAPQSNLGKLADALPAPKVGELGFGAAHCHAKIIAVTGTNGKTTTVELLKACLNAAGFKAEAGGNIGLPLSDIARNSPDAFDWIVAEVSSFQLEHPEPGFSPDVAILLNVTPDHLSRHGSMGNYRRAKLAIFDCLKDGGTACIEVKERPFLIIPNARFSVKTFSAYGNAADYEYANGMLAGKIAVDGIRLCGNHNYENILAVIAACDAMGIATETIASAIADFTPDDHRLQEIANVDGVRIIDDSKATNVDALQKALDAIGPQCNGKKIILIAGGIDKGCDLSSVKNSLTLYVKCVFVIGSCRARLTRLWQDATATAACDSLEAAVSKAKAMAKSGDVILLSPGCASQDMFHDYADRGRQFAAFATKK